MSHFFFYASFSLLLVHEMDAVRRHEWRLFPVLSKLPDETAYRVFTALHVPLFLILCGGLFGTGRLNETWSTGLSLFAIVHIGLHVLLRNHPQNEFTSVFSKGVIGGAGLTGGLDLWLG